MAGQKSVRLFILGDNKDAKAKLDEVNAKADELAAEHPELKMGIDTAVAAEHLRILREDLRSTNRDAKDVRDSLAEIKAVEFGKIGSGAGWFAGIAAAAGPLPVLLGSVSAGVAAISAAMVPAVAGLGLFGLVAKSAYSQVSGAVQQYDKVQATSGKARETALKTYKADLAALSPSQRAFASSIEKVSAAWHGFVANNQSGVTGVLNSGLGVLPALLTSLQPLLTPTEHALKSIISEIGKGVSSSGFKSFIHDLAAYAGPSLRVFASILGHIGHMAGKVIQDLMPLGTILLRDINAILAKADAGTNSAIMKFLGWLHTNGPQVMATVRNLGSALKNVGKSLMSWGSLDIGAFAAVARFIAVIASNPIGAGTLAGLLVLTKVGAAIGPLMKLVVAFKDLQEAIGIAKLASIAFMGVGIIGAIAAIITVIVLLVEHWRTVAKVASEAWSWIVHTAYTAYRDVAHFFGALYHDVLSAVDGIINWVRGHWQALAWILAGPIGLAAGWIAGHWNQIIDGADNMWHRVIGFFRAIPNGIRSVLGNLSHLLWNAGYSMLRGFLNGLLAQWNAVKGFIGGIGSWIAAHKGPISYDATLLIPHGKAIMGSLVDGLDAGMPGLTAQLTRTTNVIANTRIPGALAATGSRGGLTAEWVGGEGADAEFITWLKEHIRIRGGDPGVLGR